MKHNYLKNATEESRLAWWQQIYRSLRQTAKKGSSSDYHAASSSNHPFHSGTWSSTMENRLFRLWQTCLAQDAATLCHTERESTRPVRFKLCLWEELTVNVLNYIMFSSHMHSDVWPAALRIRKIQQQSIPCYRKRMHLQQACHHNYTYFCWTADFYT